MVQVSRDAGGIASVGTLDAGHQAFTTEKGEASSELIDTLVQMLTDQASHADIEILFDVCWILSPTQIQKLISQYHTADYESPISSDILKAVAARVKADDKNDQLLLAPETDEVGPYQLPSPRPITGLETCE